MEEAAFSGDHQVIQMPVTNAEDIRDHTISCTASNEIFQDSWTDSVGILSGIHAGCLEEMSKPKSNLCLATVCMNSMFCSVEPLRLSLCTNLRRMVRSEELLYVVIVVLENGRDVLGIRNKFNKPVDL